MPLRCSTLAEEAKTSALRPCKTVPREEHAGGGGGRGGFFVLTRGKLIVCLSLVLIAANVFNLPSILVRVGVGVPPSRKLIPLESPRQHSWHLKRVLKRS